MKSIFYPVAFYLLSVFSVMAQMSGVLKPGDSVNLEVKSDDKKILQIVATFSISDRGTLKMPMLENEIPATGISPAALIIKINDAYKTAGISAVVGLPRHEQTACNHVTTVRGGVLKPGEYPLRQGMTLLSAISRAGGFSDRIRKVKILRDKQELIYDLRKINPDGSNNPILMDGDEIIVPAK